MTEQPARFAIAGRRARYLCRPKAAEPPDGHRDDQMSCSRLVATSPPSFLGGPIITPGRQSFRKEVPFALGNDACDCGGGAADFPFGYRPRSRVRVVEQQNSHNEGADERPMKMISPVPPTLLPSDR